MIITNEFLESGMTNGIGISSAQLGLLGVGYPAMKGWKKRLVGTYIEKWKADLFLELKGYKGKEAHRKLTNARRKRRLKIAKEKNFEVSLVDTIRYKIKNAPLTVSGLNLLDKYLDKLESGQELTSGEADVVKTIEVTHRDRQGRGFYTGFVYLASSGKDKRGKTFVKIGYSANPKVRIKELTVASPNIKLLAYKKGSLKTERKLHRIFGGRRGKGEWFHFEETPSEVIAMFNETVDSLSLKDEPIYQRRKELLNKWGFIAVSKQKSDV